VKKGRKEGRKEGEVKKRKDLCAEPTTPAEEKGRKEGRKEVRESEGK
jgi:hypothetical protein